MRSLLLSILLSVTGLVLAARHLAAAPIEPAPAVMRVTLPADAKLTINGSATQSTSARRVFVSPPLPAGKIFQYTLQAEFIRAGKTITIARDVSVRAGRETLVLLDVPAEVLSYYYNAPESSTSAGTTPYVIPFTTSEDVARRGNRSSSPGFRPTHWGTDSRDAFHPGQEW